MFSVGKQNGTNNLWIQVILKIPYFCKHYLLPFGYTKALFNSLYIYPGSSSASRNAAYLYVSVIPCTSEFRNFCSIDVE